MMTEIIQTTPSYVAHHIKRSRRSKADMAEIRAGLLEIVEADAPMTVRQVFYRAVVAGLVEKTEIEYQRTVARLLLEMRRSGDLPYSWIADSTRLMRKPKTYNGLADFISRHQQAYRRDLWAEADTYVEIWCEKEALTGVLLEVTSEYDVPLMISRGFSSETYLYEAADTITDELCAGKSQAVIYYFGDHDPSGLKISDSIESGLRRLCPLTLADPDDFDQEYLVFRRIAVTERQIGMLNLPTRPTKVEGNTHAANWGDRPSVELDAIPPKILRAMVRACIEQHVDQDQLHHLRAVEAAERDQLRIFGQQVAGGAP